MEKPMKMGSLAPFFVLGSLICVPKPSLALDLGKRSIQEVNAHVAANPTTKSSIAASAGWTCCKELRAFEIHSAAKGSGSGAFSERSFRAAVSRSTQLKAK